MNIDLTNKIKDWLEKHGYPFEMNVASAFQNNGFNIAQSLYYIDTESNVAREIDVIAYRTFQIENYWISFSFIIECKTTNRPWLSFIVGDNKEENFISKDFTATQNGKALLQTLHGNLGIKHPLFPQKISNYSYLLTQALRDGDAPDIPYKAIQTLTKSIEHFVRKFDSNGLYLYYYFPIIAINCPLFEVWLSNNGEIELKEVTQTIYLSRDPKDNSFSSIINIITKETLSDYAKNCSKLVNSFWDTNKNEIIRIIKQSFV